MAEAIPVFKWLQKICPSQRIKSCDKTGISGQMGEDDLMNRSQYGFHKDISLQTCSKASLNL